MYSCHFQDSRRVFKMFMEIRDSVKVALPSTAAAFQVQPANTEIEFKELESHLTDEDERAALVSFKLLLHAPQLNLLNFPQAQPFL